MAWPISVPARSDGSTCSISDALDSFFVRHVANGSIRILKPGLFMVTAREPDDPACAWICW